MAMTASKKWTNTELVEVAKRQKQVLWMIPLSLVGMFIPLTCIVIGLIQLYFIYKLAKAERSSSPWLYIIMAFIPLISLIGILSNLKTGILIATSEKITMAMYGMSAAESGIATPIREKRSGL